MIFPFTICLSARHRQAAIESVKARCASAGLSDLVFYLGLDGLACGLRSSHPSHDQWFNSPKTVGINIGHMAIWQLIDMLPHDEVLILEDDAEFHPEFKSRWPVYKSQVPDDWEWLFVGSCCTRGKPTQHVSPYVARIRFPQCMHAYMVRKGAATKLVSSIQSIKHPIDQEIHYSTLPNIKHYTFVPSLCRQFNNGVFTDPNWIF